MPNRIIKESIRTSKNVNLLTDFQFRIWAYLITYVDDYGRGSADPELLKGIVFTRRRGVTEGQITKALTDLANIGMIVLYEVDGEPFFYFPNWGAHQTIRNKKSRFPEPIESNCKQLKSIASNCSQSVARIQSNTNTIQNPNTNTNPNSTEPSEDASVPVFALPLNDGSEYGVTKDQYDSWVKLYPAVDVMQELRNMKGWLDANPTKRKTRSGILRFCNSWLSRTQDKPHISIKPDKKLQTKFHNLEQRDDDLEEYARQKMLKELGEG